MGKPPIDGVIERKSELGMVYRDRRDGRSSLKPEQDLQPSSGPQVGAGGEGAREELHAFCSTSFTESAFVNAGMRPDRG
jgi:hypothetical protein